MARWTRDEIEQAFESYQAVALEAGISGDWNAWADQFTLDATYNEHLYGEMGGREAIRLEHHLGRRTQRRGRELADHASARKGARGHDLGLRDPGGTSGATGPRTRNGRGPARAAAGGDRGHGLPGRMGRALRASASTPHRRLIS